MREGARKKSDSSDLGSDSSSKKHEEHPSAAVSQEDLNSIADDMHAVTGSSTTSPSSTSLAIRKHLSNGNYAVWFGAADNERDALKLANAIASKYSLQAFYEIAKVGDKFIYRVRSAELTKASANDICNKVKKAGGACFVDKK